MALAIRPISIELAEVARKSLNEDPIQCRSQLEVLRSWFRERSNLHGSLDDQVLVTFLRGCKFSLEKAKEKLALFYWIRTGLTQVVQERDPLDEHVVQLIRMGVGTPLPYTEHPVDPKIFIIRVGQFDYTKCSFADVIKVGTMINDVLMRDDDQMVICGMALIIDMAKVTAGHLMQFDFEFLKQVAVLYQDASPLRMQGIHILNPPPLVQTVVSLFNGLLSPKNKDRRIFFHGTSLDSLQQHFSKSILPVEYGGDLGSIETIVNQWEDKLKQNREYLLELARLEDCSVTKLGMNGSTPPSPSVLTPTKKSASFGLDGSFRKLEID
uniref:Alpha-tocopherol transfer protein-like n=1 Tax=Culex pipiens TaxID=7175 RepID=A0A8D8HGE0_CULPI